MKQFLYIIYLEDMIGIQLILQVNKILLDMQHFLLSLLWNMLNRWDMADKFQLLIQKYNLFDIVMEEFHDHTSFQLDKANKIFEIQQRILFGNKFYEIQMVLGKPIQFHKEYMKTC